MAELAVDRAEAQAVPASDEDRDIQPLIYFLSFSFTRF